MGVAILAIPKLIEILGPAAASAGASVVGQVLRGVGGKPGAIAADVIDAVAKRVGVPPTPEALGGAAVDTPGKVEEALRQVERDKAAELAQVLASELDAIRIRAEIIKGEQASSSLLQRIWRPLNGMLFGLACLALMVTTCLVLLRGLPVSAGAVSLLALVGTVIPAWAGLVGFYAKLRTDEKKVGKA